MNEVVLRGGPPVHPWIYSKRVHSTNGRPVDGEVVRLKTREGRPCGFGFFHSRSLIAVRVLSYAPDVPPDEAWLLEKVRAANRLRVTDLRLPETTDSWRVVHAESDGLSGLVVDKYGPVASIGLYSIGWFRRLAELERVLKEALGVERVVARTDERSAVMEGFRCDPPKSAGTVEVHERETRYLVDLAGGHKTGFFLDQRDQRELIARLAKGRRVFDGMTYTGGFAIAAATRGEPAGVIAMDLDEEALAVGQSNAKRNGVEVDFRHGDVFDALRAFAAGPAADRPDLLIIDPAKWAKDRKGLGAAMAKYADLNRTAFQAVAEGGLVLTCSCSGLVAPDDFVGMLRGVALDLRTDLRFLNVGGAALDHPVSSTFPEGRYLKAVLVAPGKAGEGPGRSERPFDEDGDSRDVPSARGGRDARGGRAPSRGRDPEADAPGGGGAVPEFDR